MKNLYIFVASLCFFHAAQAQTLALDPTFGNNGMVDLPFGTVSVVDLKPTYSGKTLVLSKYNTSQYRLTRLNQDGSLDATFANAGNFNFNEQHGYGFDFEYFEDMVSLPNGKILLILDFLTTPDCSDPYDIGHSICRLNENGTLDSTFGYNGVYRIYTRDIYPKFYFLRNQSGKYSVSVSNTLFTHFLVFDEQGDFSTEGGHFNLYPNLILKEVIAVTKTDNDLTFALLTFFYDNFKLHLQRFLQDGTPDLSFGNAGVILLSDNDVNLSSVLSFTQARLIFKASLVSTGKEVLVAFNPETGNRDTTFGDGGIFQFPFTWVYGDGGVNESLTQNNIDDLGWTAMGLNHYRFEFFLKDSNLNPNLNFAPDGHGIWDMPNQLISKVNILAQDNKVLVGGEWATTAGHKISLVRLQRESATSVGAEPEKSSAIFTIQPNPSHDFMTILGSMPFARLEIFASNGSRVCTQTQPNAHVSVRDLKPGMYVVKIYGKDDKLLEIKRFVKQ